MPAKIQLLTFLQQAAVVEGNVKLFIDHGGVEWCVSMLPIIHALPPPGAEVSESFVMPF